VQSDLFGDLRAVTVLPITSTLVDVTLLRVTVELDTQNGLSKPSQIMVDKPQTPKG
jgi:mRNA interferase MazF